MSDTEFSTQKLNKSSNKSPFSLVKQAFSKFAKSKLGVTIFSVSLILVLIGGALGYFLYTENETQNKVAEASQGCASGWVVKEAYFPSTPTVVAVSNVPGAGQQPNSRICFKLSGPCTGAPTGTTNWTGASGACNYYPIGTGGGCQAGTFSNVDPLFPGICISAQQKIDRDRGYSGPFDGSGARNCWRVTFGASRPDGCTSSGSLKLPACDTLSRYAGGSATIDFIPNVPVINGCTCTNGTTNFPSCNQCPSGRTFNGSSCVSSNCTNGTINPPNCNQCASGQSFNGSSCVSSSCSNGTINPPNCNQCPIGRTFNGSSCVISNCTNGTINPPNCNQCASGQSFNGSSCVSSSCSNGTTNPPNCNQCPSGQSFNGSSCVSSNCTNGATNPPNCNQCPSGRIFNGSLCVVSSCTNGTTNPPNCNQCPSGQTFNGSSCVVSVCSNPDLINPPLCNICRAGFSFNNGICTPSSCPPGEYVNSTKCDSCPANTFKTTTGIAQSECLACPTGATSPRGSTSSNQCTCPAGQTIEGNQCVVIITPANVLNSADCTPSTIVVIPATKTCTFQVTGTGPFFLPPNTTGAFNTATGSGNCSLSGSTITCLDIPSLNGTPGLQNIILAIGAQNPTPKGQVTLQLPPIPNIIGDSTDCTTSKLVLIGQTFSCLFPINGVFTLPSGTTANVEGLNGSGSCQQVLVIGGGQAISCTSIPTTGGTVGVKNVILNIPGYTPGAKGKVTLARYIVPGDIDQTPNGSSSLANCKSQVTNSNTTVIIGDLVTCTFKVNTNDPVLLPPNTTSNIDSATGNSDNCTYDSVTKIITCINIPSNGGQPGDRNVNINIPGNPSTPKGTVTLVSPAELLIPASLVTFNPGKNVSKKFKDSDLAISVNDPRIVNGASCGFSNANYPSKSNPNSTYGVVSSAVYNNGTSATLQANSQTVPKWRFKVLCTNPTNASNGYAGRRFVAYPDYAFKYGAIILIEIGGKPLN